MARPEEEGTEETPNRTDDGVKETMEDNLTAESSRDEVRSCLSAYVHKTCESSKNKNSKILLTLHNISVGRPSGSLPSSSFPSGQNQIRQAKLHTCQENTCEKEEDSFSWGGHINQVNTMHIRFLAALHELICFSFLEALRSLLLHWKDMRALNRRILL